MKIHSVIGLLSPDLDLGDFICAAACGVGHTLHYNKRLPRDNLVHTRGNGSCVLMRVQCTLGFRWRCKCLPVAGTPEATPLGGPFERKSLLSTGEGPWSPSCLSSSESSSISNHAVSLPEYVYIRLLGINTRFIGGENWAAPSVPEPRCDGACDMGGAGEE